MSPPLPSIALSFLNHLHRTGFPHTLSTYAAITKMFAFWNLPRKLDSPFLHLITLSKHHLLPLHLFQLFEILFQDFDHHNHYLLRAFGGFVKTCVSLDMFVEAIDFLFQIGRRGIVPDVLTCNFLFNRLVEQGEVDKALAVFEQLKRFGFRPNCYSYAIVIKALCEKGDSSQAGCVFEEMETYIEGFCNKHKFAIGYKLLKEWTKSNAPLEVYAYTAVVRGFCNEMKLDEAQGVLDDMERQGLVPDVSVYSALIEGYCKGHNLSEAQGVLDDIERQGLVPDVSVYSALIKGYCEAHNLSEALALHDKMISKGVKTNRVIFGYILFCLCEMDLTFFKVMDQIEEPKKSEMLLEESRWDILKF
ncbi:hypothetical protein LR48_Vigan01g042000 [Vigna angularis]|uniref:Pentacotripeptide-repeat region of PRORP domain-containing protein n=1 Tax=Phaseolus angularis TaxID=3914 RepID=A0A0L9TJY8_PHAAN|nr:pentatricopeptide repeat-containing protein At2g26790, mitochondrial-like [Vigna angularis]KOM30865.1 hypothetical protein LR48_Vigan01g042000 [Vigna angularis]